MSLPIDEPTLRNIRRGLLAVVALGTCGIGVELVMLEHYGTVDQLIPFAVGGAGLLVMGWVAAWPSLVSLRFLQFMMLVFVGTGIVGITLHAEADVAADVAPPMLSPGVFVQLGLLGLLYTYHHPVLRDLYVETRKDGNTDERP